MVSKKDSNKARLKRHKRVRSKISGTAERPRLDVFKSAKNIYAQVIDDVAGKTLAAASTVEKEIGKMVEGKSKCEAAKIVGAEALRTGSLATLCRLAASSAMWEQRIAVVSTLTLIRADRLADALAIVAPLLYHSHDLMRKANGWMLREVGKRNLAVLTGVLDRLAPSLPRTTLRYAIERLDPVSRKHYMSLRFSEPVLDI